MKLNLDNIDFKMVVEEEKWLWYDVMVYVYMFGYCCLKVVGIIYFGVIFCYVGDNIDLIIFRNVFDLFLLKFVRVIFWFVDFVKEWVSLFMLGFIYF